MKELPDQCSPGWRGEMTDLRLDQLSKSREALA